VHDWAALATQWERGQALLWRSTSHVSEWLVDHVDPQPGETILEVAAGLGETGFLALDRVKPDGRLISSDRSAEMVGAARRVAAARTIEGVEFRVLDSERLQLPAASVDVALCRFGYVLRGHPPKALAELARVLRPGGRIGFAVWADHWQSPWMTIPRSVLVERGHLPPDCRRPEPWDEQRITALVTAVGLTPTAIEELPASYRFADADELWFYASELLGPVAAAIGALGEDERAAVRAEIERRTPRSATGGYELGGRSLNVVATTDLRREGME
jgi:SAM-dependent methyltransferase